jgi:hypothetical protein
MLPGLHVPRPFDSRARRKRWEREEKGAEFFRSSSANFPKKFRKVVDDDSEKILAGPLSLIGRLFEIYFVRLIGTPNQNSKMVLT